MLSHIVAVSIFKKLLFIMTKTNKWQCKLLTKIKYNNIKYAPVIGFKTFWISIFELARYSKQARNVLLTEFQFSSPDVSANFSIQTKTHFDRAILYFSYYFHYFRYIGMKWLLHFSCKQNVTKHFLFS